MKKLAVAVTLAVLIGGISSLHAQVIPSMPYQMYLESQMGSSSPRVSQKELERRALFHKVMQKQNKADLTFQRVYRYQDYITTTSPTTGISITTGTGMVSFSTKPFPVKAGETFSGYVYKDEAAKKDYVLVSEKVWEEIDDACTCGGYIAEETFTSSDGTKVAGKPEKVARYKVGDKAYKLIAFPFPEEKSEKK